MYRGSFYGCTTFYLFLKMLLTYLQRNQYQWELTYGLQYEMANRLNYKHQRKTIIRNVATVPQFLMHNIKNKWQTTAAFAISEQTQIKNEQTNLSSQKIPYTIQFYMENPTVGKFHPKNKDSRHRRVPKSTNLPPTNHSPTFTNEIWISIKQINI
jgi:hypothetical protein